MKAGAWNLGFGLVAVAAGASGRWALPIVQSSTALVVAGAAIASLGIYQIWLARGR